MKTVFQTQREVVISHKLLEDLIAAFLVQIGFVNDDEDVTSIQTGLFPDKNGNVRMSAVLKKGSN